MLYIFLTFSLLSLSGCHKPEFNMDIGNNIKPCTSCRIKNKDYSDYESLHKDYTQSKSDPYQQHHYAQPHLDSYQHHYAQPHFQEYSDYAPKFNFPKKITIQADAKIKGNKDRNRRSLEFK